MGFGFLLFGYLTAFLLKSTANAVGIGSLALLVGYGLMVVGIWKLRVYEQLFRFALLPLGFLLIADGYHLAQMICGWAAWNPNWINETADQIVGWIEFALILVFHSLLLPAVLRLAMSVELPKTAVSASRNLILVWIWGILYLIVQLVPFSKVASNFFTVVLTVFNFLFILLNIFLFLSCMKNIAPEGETEQPPHRYRWDLLNRIGDRFAQKQEQAADKRREETEAYLRRRKEKRDQKKNKNKN